MQVLEPSPKVTPGGVARPSSPRTLDIQAHLDDPRWQLARRIADSGGFARSRLLADFLLFIVDRHIRQRTHEITEQQIGILVFGRAEGYDASDDNIVRSYARTLRKRIDEYFLTEGSDEPLRLEVPRGGYAPVFSTPAQEPSTDNLPPSPTSPDALDPVPPPFRRHQVWLGLLVGILLGFAAIFIRPLHLLKHATASPPEAASTALWSELFSPDRDTFVVPSDGGLVIMQRLIQRPVPLERYVSGSYREDVKADGDPGAPEILKLGARRFTSVVDLGFVAHLAQLEEVVPTRMMIRYPRDLSMDDLRTGNAVLIGSVEANPWIELFEPQMNFRFAINAANDKPSGIVNLHPRPGESAIYGAPGPDHTYGVIAYRPNLTSTGHVLIVGGLNTAGTEAATTFLLTPSLMMPTLQRAKSAHGALQPFELLIGAGSVATHASAPQAVAERIGPA